MIEASTRFSYVSAESSQSSSSATTSQKVEFTIVSDYIQIFFVTKPNNIPNHVMIFSASNIIIVAL